MLIDEVDRLQGELDRVNSGLRDTIFEEHMCVFSADMDGNCFVCRKHNV